MSDVTRPTAGIGPRALARLIDFVLLAVVNAVLVGALLVGALLGLTGGFVSGVGALLGAVVNLAYFAGLETRGGQTVGKMVLKLRVTGPTGALPTLEQAVRRNIWVAFGAAGIVPVVGGLVGSLAQLAAVVLIAISLADASRGPAWHDRFAGGTAVVSSETVRAH